jgi:D-3-phosphoglycerate dehydrogenase / 2-oxoglutarate reductase
MKILIATYPFLLDFPEIDNCEFVNNPWGKRPSAGELEQELITGEYDGLIVGTTRIKNSITKQAGLLKVISRVGVGVNNIDIKLFEKHGILTTNTPFALTNSAAEMALAMILAGIRRLVSYNEMVKNKKWNRKFGLSLAEATVGIVGFGKIGKRVATLLKAFDCNIILKDADPDFITAQEMDLKFVSKEEILEKSDIITLHLPSDDNTRDWLSFKELKNLEKPVIIVNTARGDLVNENAVYEYLKSHDESYYCCDVYVEEPYSGKLTELDNVLLTPHVSTFTFSSRRQAEQLAIENCLDVLSGKSCSYIVKSN